MALNNTKPPLLPGSGDFSSIKTGLAKITNFVENTRTVSELTIGSVVIENEAMTGVASINGVVIEDHGSRHGFNSADPIGIPNTVSTLSTSNTAGTSNIPARADHTHTHGSLAGGSLHTAVTTVANGFMTGADKTKLDGIEAGATYKPIGSDTEIFIYDAGGIGTDPGLTFNSSNETVSTIDLTINGTLTYDFTTRFGQVVSSLGDVFEQTNKLVGTGSVGNSSQGSSVSLNSDSTYLAIGGSDDNSGVGATWVFTRSGTTWSQQAKLVGSLVANTFPFQGVSVSLNSDGTYLAASGFSTVWIFTRTGTSWAQQVALVAPSNVSSTFSNFGACVSINSDASRIAIGVSNDNSSVGAALIYTRSGTTWSQEAKLIATNNVGNSRQGFSISLNSDASRVAVGGNGDSSSVGATWIFSRSGTTWIQEAKLVGATNVGSSQQGISVSLNSDAAYLAVGGSADNSNVGATWIFSRSGTTWTGQAKLVGAGNIGASRQGKSVSLNPDGTSVAMGGFFDNSLLGATWIFTRSGTTWTQSAKLVGTGSSGSSVFQGASVSLNSSYLAIGATSDDPTGATWIFKNNNITQVDASSTLELTNYWSGTQTLRTGITMNTNGRFQVAETAYYVVSVSVGINSVTSGSPFTVFFSVNGDDTTKYSPNTNDVVLTPFISNISTAIYMNAGDYVSVFVTNSSGSAIDLYSDDFIYSIYKIITV